MIYSDFKATNSYSKELQACIESTVDNLLIQKTTVTHPGMLLGKIQCGKTRTYIGVMALAFDKGFDICVVFTKGTRALAEQTCRRLDSEFREFIEDDIIKVYDIMNMPDQLTPYLRRQKIILIVKKQTDNLSKLTKLFKTYPDLIEKKALFIDDEADFASVGFKRDKKQQDGISMNVLATKINSIRSGCDNNYGFLQVTATPNSLYLQPKGKLKLNNCVIEPIRPAFTSLVPIHDKYIGGKQYFEDSHDPDSVFSHLYVQVPDDEIQILNRKTPRDIGNILSASNLPVFHQAIVNYLIAGSIRIIQCKEQNLKNKSSFIIHTSITQARHQLQIDITRTLIEKLTKLAKRRGKTLEILTKESYENFVPSIQKNGGVIPSFKEVLSKVKESLINGYIDVVRVNSENKILGLLDKNGQLRLDNPFNIFVGGQILDRGLTIDNLIGFFYGRSPSRFQQDTVLQHSRMYGARSMEDIAVTRFYTSNEIYRVLNTIHSFDATLWNAFEKGTHNEDAGVVFLERDESGEIRPCAPNKILITSTETIHPCSRSLPIGFQTKPKSSIESAVKKIDMIVKKLSGNGISEPFLITLEDAEKIVRLIASTYVYGERWNNKGLKWEINTFRAIMKRLVDNIHSEELKGKIYCYAQTNRNISRMINNNTAFTDAPDSGTSDLPMARNVASETPCLILLKQNGLSKNGWRGAEFWWPILVSPRNARQAIFARETME